jgi:hypothetical protein
MRSITARSLAWVALPIASCAAFWVAAAALDPALVGRPASTRPLTENERREVLAALDGARRIYADFFSSGGAPALLDEFPATASVKHRIFRDIGFLRDRGVVQVQDLAAATPLSVERTGEDSVEAVIYEEWNYILQRNSDRVSLTEDKGTASGFRYRLHRTHDRRWVISSWEPEEVAPPATRPGFKY